MQRPELLLNKVTIPKSSIRKFIAQTSGNSAVVLTSGAVVLTSGAVVLTSGAVVLTSGAVVLTSGAVVLTSGAVILTSGAAVLTCRALIPEKSDLKLSPPKSNQNYFQIALLFKAF